MIILGYQTMNYAGQNPETRIALFQRKEVRRTIHNNEWWFVVEDVVLALIDSRDPKQYIQRMKQRDPELGKGWVQIVHTLFIPTDGADRDMRGACAPHSDGIPSAGRRRVRPGQSRSKKRRGACAPPQSSGVTLRLRNATDPWSPWR